jgi:hypothetical protein
MFVIYGRKASCIKKTFDHIGTCTSCNAVGLNVNVYKKYFHIFWIPFFPYGAKEFEVHCHTCGKANNYNDRVKHFAAITRTPIYLFSGLLLVAGLVVWMIFVNQRTQRDKALFIANPQVGDVYTLRQDFNDTTQYTFLRVARIEGDSVFAYPNQYRYFSFTSRLDETDAFLELELGYTRQELKGLLESGEINGVDRQYGDEEGFNRIKSFVPEDLTPIDTTTAL